MFNPLKLTFADQASICKEGMIVISRQQQICFFNSFAEEMFGYSAEQVLNQSLSVLLPQVIREYHLEHSEKIWSGAEPFELKSMWREVTGVRSDGSNFPVELSISRLQQEDQEYMVVILRDTSEQKRIQNELVSAKQDLESTLAMVQDVALVISREGRYERVAPTDPSHLMAPPEQLLNHYISDFFDPQKTTLFMDVVTRVLDTKQPGYLEYDAKINGEDLWFDARVLYYDADNVLWLARDVTQHKRVERELLLSQRQYKAIVEGQSELICRSGPDRRLTFTNQAYCRFFGKSSEDWVGVDFLPLIYEEDQNKVETLLAGLSPESPSFECEQRVYNRDGEIRWTNWIDQAFFDENGRMIELHSVGRDITDIKLVYLRLQEAEQSYRNLVDQLPAIAYIHKANTGFSYITPQIEDFLGYSSDEVLLKNGFWVELIHPEDRLRVIDHFNNVLLHNLPLNVEYRVRKKFGDYVWVQDIGRVINPEFLSGRNVEGIIIDITERHEVLENLEFHSLFEDLIADISARFVNVVAEDIDWEINEALRQLGEFTGVDRSYVFLLDEENHNASNTHEWCLDGVEPQIEFLQEIPFETIPWWINRLYHHENIYFNDLSDMPSEAVGEKALLSAQKIQSLLVVPMITRVAVVGFLGFDCVNQKKKWSEEIIYLLRMVANIFASAMERILNEKRRDALLKAIPDMMVRVDENGRILDYTNAVHQQLFPSENIIGRNLKSILPEKIVQKMIWNIQLTLGTGNLQYLDFGLDTSLGYQTFEVRFSQSGKREVTAIIRDTTEKVKLDQMKSDFLNRASHDLRTPLSTISLMVDLIDKNSAVEMRRKYWDILKAELKRERLLIDDMLTVSSLEKDALQIRSKRIQVLPILQDAIETNAAFASEKGLLLEKNFASEVIWIRGDNKALQQVFGNLMSNAVKFTPSGGRIRISASCEGGQALFTFEDTGIGIPEEEQEKVITRFYRAGNALENEYPGSGLGLYIVYSLIAEMQGQITMQSKVGEGTTFRIVFPLDD